MAPQVCGYHVQMLQMALQVCGYHSKIYTHGSPGVRKPNKNVYKWLPNYADTIYKCIQVAAQVYVYFVKNVFVPWKFLS